MGQKLGLTRAKQSINKRQKKGKCGSTLNYKARQWKYGRHLHWRMGPCCNVIIWNCSLYYCRAILLSSESQLTKLSHFLESQWSFLCWNLILTFMDIQFWVPLCEACLIFYISFTQVFVLTIYMKVGSLQIPVCICSINGKCLIEKMKSDILLKNVPVLFPTT